MAFEGLICPNCSGELDDKQISKGDLKCPHCKVNIRQKKYLAFLEYLMMNGLVNDIDFFDQKVYGHEVERETVEQKELDDYTNPSDYEDKTEKFKNYDESADLKEVTTDEEQFRAWDGVDEDWEEFNSKDGKKKKNS